MIKRFRGLELVAVVAVSVLSAVSPASAQIQTPAQPQAVQDAIAAANSPNALQILQDLVAANPTLAAQIAAARRPPRSRPIPWRFRS